jgi:transposase-like protein
MAKPRRIFSAEFKREAADLVLKQNYSFIEASRSLSIGETDSVAGSTSLNKSVPASPLRARR